MPIMYPPRAKGRALNVHPGQVPRMAARGWSFEPHAETQRIEAPAKLTAAEREELRGVLADALAEAAPKLTGGQRAAIRGGAAYEPPKRKRKQGKDADR